MKKNNTENKNSISKIEIILVIIESVIIWSGWVLFLIFAYGMFIAPFIVK